MTTDYPLGTRYIDNMDVIDLGPYLPQRFAVIGRVESVPVGNLILRVGRTISTTDRGWIQELHLVLTPDERKRLIVDLVAQETGPAVDVYDNPASTELAWAWEGGIAKGNIDAFADFLQGCQDAGHDTPKVVYAAAVDGTLTPVPFQVKAGGYDEHDYATATVTVTLADGVAVTGSWTVDGRA